MKTENNKNNKNAVTGTFQQVRGGFAVGSVQRSLTEKTLKKRLARLANSKGMVTLATLMTLSALLTVFRGYIAPIAICLTVERILIASVLWCMYATGGKMGRGLLPWLPVIETVVAAILCAFFAVFVFCGMFAKLFLISGQEELVRTIVGAGMWAVVPALAALATGYCVFLFKRHERLICCNVRDGLKYGFAFDKGAGKFMQNCLIVAIALAGLAVFKLIVGDFSAFGFLGEDGARLFNIAFNMDESIWLTFLGNLVHGAALLVAGAMAVRYSSTVKRYRQQRDAQRRAEDEAREGIKELCEIEQAKETEKALNA